MTKIDTGLKDENGVSIFVGDTLYSQWDYFVIVCYDDSDNSYYGKLICEPGDLCENIPYHLNDGNGYVVIR
jgi:hypothetical protein